MVRRIGAAVLIWTVLACPVACSDEWYSCAASAACPPNGCCLGGGCGGGLPVADHSHHAPADHCAGHGCLCAGAVVARGGTPAVAFAALVVWFAGPQAGWSFDCGQPAVDAMPGGVLLLPVVWGRDLRLALRSLLI